MVIAMTVVKSGSFQTYVESQDVLRRVCIWGVKEEPSMPFKFLPQQLERPQVEVWGDNQELNF